MPAKTNLFPEFTENKFSIRLCNTKNYSQSPLRFISVSKDMKLKLDAKEHYVYVHADLKRNSIIFTKNPRKGGLKIDLNSAKNTKLCGVLNSHLSLEQGVTYFGQETKIGSYKAIEFKTSKLSKSIVKNKTILENAGVPVL